MRSATVFLLAAALAWAPPVSSNKLIDLGVKENYKRAELVLIGRVSATDVAYRKDFPKDRAATVEVELIVKGKLRAKTVRVVYYVGNPELSFPCCQVGRKYLFFLRTAQVEGAYFTYDGKHGAFLLEEDLMQAAMKE